MKFGNVSLVFDRNWDSLLTDFLGRLLEGDDDENLECRKILDSFVKGLIQSDPKVGLAIDEGIGAVMNAYSGIFFTAGYIIGQNFDITDPEALKEIEFLKGELQNIIPLWPKEKAPDHPTKEDSEASSRQ